MSIEVGPAPEEKIAPLRELHRQEMNCQIIHDSLLQRGLTESHLIQVDQRPAGYGLLGNKHYPKTVLEFYVLPAKRGEALPIFRQLLEASGAERIRAQTNDRLLNLMLHDCAFDIRAEVVIFEDGFVSGLSCPGGLVRQVTESDGEALEEQKLGRDNPWLLEVDGVPVATGGVLFHYNPPYGDIYMEVSELHRRRGYGGFMVQELKRVTYEMGKIPAARCNITNVASRRTLQNAGLLPCGHILEGAVAK